MLEVKPVTGNLDALRLKRRISGVQAAIAPLHGEIFPARILIITDGKPEADTVQQVAAKDKSRFLVVFDAAFLAGGEVSQHERTLAQDIFPTDAIGEWANAFCHTVFQAKVFRAELLRVVEKVI